MIKTLFVTDDVEVARIDGALMFRAWDEVESDFNAWRAVDADLIGLIDSMNESDDLAASIVSSISTHNLTFETALAIVRAVRAE